MFIERDYSIILQNNYKNVDKVRSDLYKTIKFAIDNGATGFILYYEGYFNKMALNICREFRKIHPYLTIKIVITDLNIYFQKESKKYKRLYNYYKDAEIMFYLLEQDNANKTYQIYNFIIKKSMWTISYITESLQKFFKLLCFDHYISVINLTNCQKLCFHKKNDELPHQILKSIII